MRKIIIHHQETTGQLKVQFKYLPVVNNCQDGYKFRAI